MFDITIIGAGVVGVAIARELSRYQLRILVLEREPDLCFGTSGRNSGVLHAGFNNKPGSLMSRFCLEGNREFDRVARELDIPLKRTGKLVVGFDEDDRAALERMIAQGKAGGVPGLSMVGRDAIRQLAPAVCGQFAMLSESTAILSPFEYTIALAENAFKNGVLFRFGASVETITEDEGTMTVMLEGGERIRTRFVVNAAGHGAARLARMTGLDDIETFPCRGEYYVLDRRVGERLPLPAYPVPNPKLGGLGIHLTPTVDGNLLIGPSNEYIESSGDMATTASVLDELLRDGRRLLPALDRAEVIRSFSGVRPKLTAKGGYHDFVIERSHPSVVNLVGIESPGLTSALPIARYVRDKLSVVCDFTPRADFQPVRHGFPKFASLSDEDKAALIARNPDFGEILCRCETITKAEVLDAIRRPLGARTVAGIKNRCRASMGRCQGGYCGGKLTAMLAAELGTSCAEVRQHREGSWIVREGA
ncbi:MAG: NAD(P)/FAD-dependent oxidoreductase [Clostridiaceae bacterium]|nr:NAD(P)/FAD-dependent oxidoreductase [Clostridiaceae bacterium]